jgi:hypothetical protein
MCGATALRLLNTSVRSVPVMFDQPSSEISARAREATMPAFARPTPAPSATWDDVRDQLAQSFPEICPLMNEVNTEVLVFSVRLLGAVLFPSAG